MLLRLCVLVMAAIMPALLVMFYIQIEIGSEQTESLSNDASAHVEFINGNLKSIVDSIRQVTLVLSKQSQIQAFDPTCRANIDVLKPFLKSYKLIEVTDENGQILCSSADRPDTATSHQREQNMATLARGTFETGLFRPGGATLGPMLMFNLPFTGQENRRGVISVGLSLRWLTTHFQSLQQPADSFIGIADREGTTLVMLPDTADRAGKPLAADLIKMARQSGSGIKLFTNGMGADRVVGYIPAESTSIGLSSIVGLSLPDLTKPVKNLERRAFGMLALGMLISACLVLLVGQQIISRPRRSLMAAAKAWADGNLDARVEIFAHANSDFVSVATAFNDMAANLDHQRTEGKYLQTLLEVQVAARTTDLINSRNRLQVALAQQAKSEASLRQAQKMQAVGQLAGGIAHDFNNLLTAVIGALEMIRNRVTEDDHRSLRLLDTALLAADRGAKLTSQLLGFSRRQRLLPVATDLNVVIEGMMGLLASTLGAGIRLKTELGCDVWPALVDPHQVEAAILNLALNARDAMTIGGSLRIATRNACLPRDSATKGQGAMVSPSDRLAVSDPAPPGDYVLIQVIDTGSGMPPEVLAHVFEPFFTTKEMGRGSGLGLSQVHGLAAQSGGELQIESREGIGTSVSLLLPRVAGVAASPTLPRQGLRTPLRNLRVLVADDDDDVRRLTGDMLNDLGHTALLAESGADALHVLETEPSIDMLLADYAMPGMTGLALIEYAVQGWPGMGAILVTGHADIDATGSAGRYRVLHKPFSFELLADMLAKAHADRADITLA